MLFRSTSPSGSAPRWLAVQQRLSLEGDWQLSHLLVDPALPVGEVAEVPAVSLPSVVAESARAAPDLHALPEPERTAWAQLQTSAGWSWVAGDADHRRALLTRFGTP